MKPKPVPWDDTGRINYLQNCALVEMDNTTGRTDFLVLAMDGTTCWGKTFREAVDNAIKHDEWMPILSKP